MNGKFDLNWMTFEWSFKISKHFKNTQKGFYIVLTDSFIKVWEVKIFEYEKLQEIGL